MDQQAVEIPAAEIAALRQAGEVITFHQLQLARGGLNYEVPQCSPGTIVAGGTTYAIPAGGVTAATAGRYVLADGTTVIYAISPGRFVLVDTNALTTSPGVSLAY